jgi:hypothetical protein
MVLFNDILGEQTRSENIRNVVLEAINSVCGEFIQSVEISDKVTQTIKKEKDEYVLKMYINVFVIVNVQDFIKAKRCIKDPDGITECSSSLTMLMSEASCNVVKNIYGENNEVVSSERVDRIQFVDTESTDVLMEYSYTIILEKCVDDVQHTHKSSSSFTLDRPPKIQIDVDECKM